MKINGQLMIIRVEISKEAFVVRNSDAVPLRCIWEREREKFARPREKNYESTGERQRFRIEATPLLLNSLDK